MSVPEAALSHGNQAQEPSIIHQKEGETLLFLCPSWEIMFEAMSTGSDISEALALSLSPQSPPHLPCGTISSSSGPVSPYTLTLVPLRFLG